MAGLLDKVRNTPVKVAGRIVLLSGGTVFCLFQLCDLMGLRINTSPSLPVGFYKTTSNPDANLIESCPAEPYGNLAAIRGYRARGTCPDGAAPLLKPVVAKPGDIVELSNRGIAVNGKLLPNTAPLSRDTKGRPLVPFPFGVYKVPNGSVWVASSYNPRSFDSRYFGPIALSSVRARLRPIFTLR
jgi:conjugative transfer signal peptidase TraF